MNRHTPYRLTISSQESFWAYSFSTSIAAMSEYESAVSASVEHSEQNPGSPAARVCLYDNGLRILEHTPDGFMQEVLDRTNPPVDVAVTILLREILEAGESLRIPKHLTTLAQYISDAVEGERSDAE